MNVLHVSHTQTHARIFYYCTTFFHNPRYSDIVLIIFVGILMCIILKLNYIIGVYFCYKRILDRVCYYPHFQASREGLESDGDGGGWVGELILFIYLF